ncbi:MAG TPA: exonuclease domain-containing protein [Gammaproteobacteria bacterium]|nr:exonuclease domain-containing protein [Gammaproteobacteria bacterium]
MHSRPLAIVDLETTGTHPRIDRIIEIGVVLVDPDGTTREWQTLIDPEVSIPPFIENFTGISDADVAAAPRFADIADELLELLGDRIFVAHNARFDYGFLRHEFQRAGLRFQRQPLCTVKLSRRLYPAYSRHNLDALVGRHGLAVDDRHRALGDARLVHRFLETARREHGAEALEAAINELIKRPSLPPHLPAAEVDALPEAPGVYRFYDENGLLLYVGKSVNIRSRVLSHFSADHSSAREMRLAQQVRHIECTTTTGELGALLLENREIKERAPVLNRRQRRAERLHTFRLADDPAAEPVLAIVDVNAAALAAANHYGLFRTKRQAENLLRELAAEHGFCARKLGLESRGRRGDPCFAHQLKKCRGACTGVEPEVKHHLRLMQALGKLRIATWPWPGRIGVRERNADGHIDMHIIENWCYLGTVRERDLQGDLFDSVTLEGSFELDTYRILVRHLLDRKKRPDIVLLDRQPETA